MSNYLSSAVVVASKGIFGTKRLVSGYAGHAFDLRYQGDNATLTVDFLGDDTLDVASINTWVAARSGGPQNVRISKWYDQSGNGNDLVQATAASQPGLETGTALYKSTSDPADGIPCVYLNEAYTNPINHGFMTFAGGSFSNHDFSVLAVARGNDQYQDQQNEGPSGPAFQMGTVSTDCGMFSDENRVHQSSPIIAKFVKTESLLGNSFPASGTSKSMRLPNTSFSAISVKNNGVTAPTRFGNWRNVPLTSVGTLATGLSGLKMGVCFGGTFTSTCILTAFVVTTALGTTDEQAALDTLAASYGLSNTPTTILAVDGDSITSGYQGGLFSNRCFSWFRSVARSIGNAAACFNLSQSGGWIGKVNSPWGPLSGEGAGTAGVQQGGQAPDSLDPLLDSGQFAHQVLIVYLGRNDIGLYGSGASAGFGTTIYNELVTYCQARQAAGWKVIICDAIPGSDIIAGNMASETAIFNALIAANWATFADQFVQLSALNWQPGGSSDWSLYQDQIHPNAAGQAMIAAAVLPAVEALVGLLPPTSSISYPNFYSAPTKPVAAGWV